MKSRYHQLEIQENHKERTAFTVGPLGLWEFNRLAFGLIENSCKVKMKVVIVASQQTATTTSSTLRKLIAIFRVDLNHERSCFRGSTMLQ